MTPTKVPPNVLTRRGLVLVLGPLGCYDVADRLEVDGEEYLVTSIDNDGAGIARPMAHVMAEVEELQATMTEAEAKQEVLKKYAHVRTCYPLEFATDTAQAGMKAQQERNRQKYC